MPEYAIIRLHRDLRVSDHAPLHEALARGLIPVPVYIHDPAEAAGGATTRWLHDALADLDATLRRLGSRLTLRAGAAETELARLVSETGARHVYWHRRYDPAGIARDTALKARLRDAGVTAQSFAGDCLHEPHAVANKAGGPFRVFTPFWRHVATLPVSAPIPAPPTLPAPPAHLASTPLADLGLKPVIPWDTGIAADWDMSRHGAEARLRGFLGADGAVGDYEARRDVPGVDGTSRLSPYLHFGQLSVREARAAALAVAGPGRERFMSQLGWREFGRHLLYHFPDTLEKPLDPKYAGFPWVEAPELLRAWRQGRTGAPIVDAGMRQLRATGWMHNRVRMIAASYLVKNLRIDWRHGAAWFMDNLVDADAAQNTLGWQWVAGCGADAAPYHRVFNPVLQGEKFDPAGDYVRRFVPELATMPAKWIHRPWAAPESLRRTHAQSYAEPLIDLALSRERALAAHAAMRARAPG